MAVHSWMTKLSPLQQSSVMLRQDHHQDNGVISEKCVAFNHWEREILLSAIQLLANQPAATEVFKVSY